MTHKLGYLLPTRENVMQGEHGTASLLRGARTAAGLGFDSLWVGDSLFARPRHDPLTLLAGLATAVPRVQLGTAVLLPALRNPVVLAQQLATIDQLSEGRLVLGVGIAADNPSVRAEFAAAGISFDRRVGRLVEGLDLCRALWRGEPVDWTGRWPLQQATLAPVPYRPGGPPIWYASSVDAGIRRAAKRFDGWFPIGPDAQTVAGQHRVLLDEAASLNRPRPTTAIYLTLCFNQDAAAGQAQLDAYLEGYYGVPANIMRQFQSCCAGPEDDVLSFLQAFVQAGAEHLVIRLVGDHEAGLRCLARRRGEI